MVMLRRIMAIVDSIGLVMRIDCQYAPEKTWNVNRSSRCLVQGLGHFRSLLAIAADRDNEHRLDITKP